MRRKTKMTNEMKKVKLNKLEEALIVGYAALIIGILGGLGIYAHKSEVQSNLCHDVAQCAGLIKNCPPDGKYEVNSVTTNSEGAYVIMYDNLKEIVIPKILINKLDSPDHNHHYAGYRGR
jgi:hypothetical protein